MRMKLIFLVLYLVLLNCGSHKISITDSKMKTKIICEDGVDTNRFIGLFSFGIFYILPPDDAFLFRKAGIVTQKDYLPCYEEKIKIKKI